MRIVIRRSPTVLFSQQIDVELAHPAKIEALIVWRDQFVEIGKGQRRHVLLPQVSLGLHDLAGVNGRILQHARVRRILAFGGQNGAHKLQSKRVGHQQRLTEKHGSRREHRRILVVGHAGAHDIDDLRGAQNVLAYWGQRVVDQHHHGLAFGNALARSLSFFHNFFLRIGLWPGVFGASQFPFLKINLLVLQRMGEFVRQHRLLNVRLHPVEQIDALRLGIVVSGHLLAQQTQKLRVQIVSRRKQPEFLQHEPRLLQPLRIFIVLHALVNVALHRLPGD